MGQPRRRVNMYDPVPFRICIQGKLEDNWTNYFSSRSILVELDEAGHAVTVIESEPIDQGALVGLINRLNFLGIPVISVELAN